MYHGRLTPFYSGSLSDEGLLNKIRNAGKEWDGIRFYFDRWTEFEMPERFDSEGKERGPYKSFKAAWSNNHIEVLDGPAPKE